MQYNSPFYCCPSAFIYKKYFILFTYFFLFTFTWSGPYILYTFLIFLTCMKRSHNIKYKIISHLDKWEFQGKISSDLFFMTALFKKLLWHWDLKQTSKLVQINDERHLTHSRYSMIVVLTCFDTFFHLLKSGELKIKSSLSSSF